MYNILACNDSTKITGPNTAQLVPVLDLYNAALLWHNILDFFFVKMGHASPPSNPNPSTPEADTIPLCHNGGLINLTRTDVVTWFI